MEQEAVPSSSPKEGRSKLQTIHWKTVSSPAHLRKQGSGGVRCGRCDEEMRDPRLLACLHSFCSPCIQQEITTVARQLPPPPSGSSVEGGNWDEDEEQGQYWGSVTLSYSGYESIQSPNSAVVLRCWICGWGTRLSSPEISLLPLDTMIMTKFRPNNQVGESSDRTGRSKERSGSVDRKRSISGGSLERGEMGIVAAHRLGQARHRARLSAAQTSHTLETALANQAALKERCKEVEGQIEAYIQSYHDALEEHRQAMLDQLAQVGEGKLQAMCEHVNNLQQKMSYLETALAYSDHLLKEASEAELMNLGGLVQERLDWCLGQCVDEFQVNLTGLIQLLPQEKAVCLRGHQLYGVLTTQTVSPPHSYLIAHSLSNCRQHKKAEAILVTRDHQRQQVCHGGERIAAELRYRDSSQRLVPVSVSDQGDGTYHLSFTPDSPGTLSLSVAIQDQHIQGSPYKVSVFTLRPHSGLFHCCTFCSSKGNKTAVCGCGCIMPGGYKGCGHGHSGHPGRRHWSCCGNVLYNSECSRPVTYQFSL